MKDKNRLEGPYKRNTHEYKGKLAEFQQLGSLINGERYMEYEADPFNSYQNFLYKRVVHGLNIYNQEEISVMPDKKRTRILKNHRKAQRVLNLYKQEVVNKLTNSFFQKYFPSSPITKALTGECNITDTEFVNTLDFKSLGITKDQIVDQLIKAKLLPANFHELKSISLHE
jgi:hypothetical protein